MSDIPMAEDFKVVRSRLIWVSEEDMDTVYRLIRERGTLDCAEKGKLDSETGHEELVQYYDLIGDNEAEVFWADEDMTELRAIRVAVVYDEQEEKEYHSVINYKRGMFRESIDDVHSDSLTPYMRFAFWRALGVRIGPEERCNHSLQR